MDPRPTPTEAPCLLCRSCANWCSTAAGERCGAGVRVALPTWACDSYVREFRPLRYYDRRRVPRGSADRRQRGAERP